MCNVYCVLCNVYCELCTVCTPAGLGVGGDEVEDQPHHHPGRHDDAGVGQESGVHGQQACNRVTLGLIKATDHCSVRSQNFSDYDKQFKRSLTLWCNKL